MSERKVLNKYYPPDFDPSKIPRVKGSKNRQFTVRLMAPCNMKCYTCGEYIAKGKKFNARKEDVDNMNFLGIRIYRFYIRCPGCISEISFRTDPESTDYVLEAGAHRNFQALKLAEEQAAREAQEAQEEIESNPMLLLENRTQQSQYEMDLLETLEDLRDQNDRHASIDLGAVAGKYQKERELTAEQIDEQERMEAFSALGYEMIEGKLVKRLKEEDLKDELPSKKMKAEGSLGSDYLTNGNPSDVKKSQNSLKTKLSGLVKKKTPSTKPPSQNIGQNRGFLSRNKSVDIPDNDRLKMPPPSHFRRIVQSNVTAESSSSSDNSAHIDGPDDSGIVIDSNNFPTSSSGVSIEQDTGVGLATDSSNKNKCSSLTLLGQYSDSSSGSDDD
ncbi:hypothetical protein HAZT_HAZT006095 [Hyalella azteca]|uniref:Splicing factor YJU2 n=1 Tax=Hyalella azteca TaxID=294128 RepID=A0A6A0H2W2_HYAAZ|nr:splicing factor YJU2-like [Hyalella azteca]KAA0197798.1 hypothetical protein HAZT_HAZT006095 [Hyalella azteca]